ncbi:MAG: hypothetical protein HC841_09025 [Verrucomicrobiae bacterium]|nr:hypothetical protein [Verrucomicrobiae bacterium]
MREIVEQIITPLAELCAKNGKRIMFENKNIFWGGTCYVDFWNKVFFDPKLRGVFIPALEESNSRSQEISLAGRVGLWKAGVFDQWVSRAIMDNACFDRMWEWSSQQVFRTTSATWRSRHRWEPICFPYK